MRKHQKAWLLAAVSLLLIAYVIYSNWIQQEVKAVATISTITDKTAYEGVEIVTETIKHDNYSISSNYPTFIQEQLTTTIKNYIEEEQNAFLTLVEDKTIKQQPTLTISSEIVPGFENTLNILITTTSLIDKETTMKKIFIVDYQAQKLLTVENMIDSGYLTNTVITKLVNDHISVNDALKQIIKESFVNDTFLSNVYLTADELKFIYSKDLTYDTISIPLSSVVFALKEPYKTIIQEKINIEKVESSSKKQIALTFDDGPHPTFTKRILDTLEKYNAKATFFMLGREVEKNPLIAQEVANAGHEIGNHSWYHENLTKLTISGAVENLHRTNEKIYEITGYYPTLYRPPYGAINEALTNAIPMENIMWSIDTKDWKLKNTALIMDIIQSHLEDGAIILLHDIHKETANSLETILTYLEKHGYECVTVSELNK